MILTASSRIGGDSSRDHIRPTYNSWVEGRGRHSPLKLVYGWQGAGSAVLVNRIWGGYRPRWRPLGRAEEDARPLFHR
jgi:hypothetical protein